MSSNALSKDGSLAFIAALTDCALHCARTPATAGYVVVLVKDGLGSGVRGFASTEEDTGEITESSLCIALSGSPKPKAAALVLEEASTAVELFGCAAPSLCCSAEAHTKAASTGVQPEAMFEAGTVVELSECAVRSMRWSSRAQANAHCAESSSSSEMGTPKRASTAWSYKSAKVGEDASASDSCT